MLGVTIQGQQEERRERDTWQSATMQENMHKFQN